VKKRLNILTSVAHTVTKTFFCCFFGGFGQFTNTITRFVTIEHSLENKTVSKMCPSN